MIKYLLDDANHSHLMAWKVLGVLINAQNPQGHIFQRQGTPRGNDVQMSSMT